MEFLQPSSLTVLVASFFASGLSLVDIGAMFAAVWFYSSNFCLNSCILPESIWTIIIYTTMAIALVDGYQFFGHVGEQGWFRHAFSAKTALDLVVLLTAMSTLSDQSRAIASMSTMAVVELLSRAGLQTLQILLHWRHHVVLGAQESEVEELINVEGRAIS